MKSSPLPIALAAIVAIPGLALSGAGQSGVGKSHVVASPQDTSVADLLWLPAEAQLERDFARPVSVRNGRSIYVDGSAAVVFTIDIDPQELSRRLIQHFATSRWHQRNYQFMNPGLATSFELGWRVTHGGPPYEPWREWEGEWDDENGGVLTYVAGGKGHQLRGLGSYLPRSVREELVHKLRR